MTSIPKRLCRLTLALCLAAGAAQASCMGARGACDSREKLTPPGGRHG